MTDDEGLSVREAVDWCGSCLTVREKPGCCGLTAFIRAVETDGSDERQAGRRAPRYLGSVLADRQHGVPALGIPKERGFPQVCVGRAACRRFWLDNSEEVRLNKARDGCRHGRTLAGVVRLLRQAAVLAWAAADRAEAGSAAQLFALGVDRVRKSSGFLSDWVLPLQPVGAEGGAVFTRVRVKETKPSRAKGRPSRRSCASARSRALITVVGWEFLEVLGGLVRFLREMQDAPAEEVRSSAPIGGAMVSYRSSALWLFALP
jgi:hypothetical protein